MDLSTLMPQQRDVVTTLDRRLFVSAGAGSGKTFTLTKRILWALSPESGPFATSLDQIMAITFTKDAAAEIRERVRAALIQEGMDEAALAVDDAWISTIHGMCSRILRAHALELGLDPEFTVVEEAQAAELMDLAVDRVIARSKGKLRSLFSWYQLEADSAPSASTPSVSIRGIVRALAVKASASKNGFNHIRFFAGGADLSSLADAYRPVLEGTPKAAEVARDALDAIDEFEASDQTWDDLVTCMMSCKMPHASKAFPKEQVALLKAEAADAFVNAIIGVSESVIDELDGLACAAFNEYNKLKLQQSALDNDDLLRMAYDALAKHESIREEYANRFRLVMIDEFQDTAQQQVDLIGFLTGEGARALCTVGDAQQSIYRFRGADVEVFRRAERATLDAGDDGSAGQMVKLVKNFRSHAEILDFVARIFDDAQGGLMPGFLDLLPDDKREDGLVAAGASRRQALLAVGGSRAERTQAKAAAIARRFRALADAGQPVGGMVLLLGGMPRADVYADAMRAEGLDCVIAGGSIFARSEEARAVRALICALANPQDAQQGLAPLLASPMFALGAQEFLALATAYDATTGETRRRNIEQGILSDGDAPGLGGLPLLDRAREIMRRALSRVGRDSMASIARDAVGESGWLVRLAARGAEGKAQAANVLKALDFVAEAEAQAGRSPRAVVQAYDRALAGKQAPGALNEEGGNAVRIMTVHASKGLEFPVVAVSECYDIRRGGGCVQMDVGPSGHVNVVALPDRFADAHTPWGDVIPGEDIKKYFSKFLGRSNGGPWLAPELVDDVCSSFSAAGAFCAMRDQERMRAIEERARLLYVAMTRARDVCLLAMDAAVSRAKVPELKLDAEVDLTGPVLERILPDDGASLAVDRLVFDNAQAGDFELITLRDFVYNGDAYSANALPSDDLAAEDTAQADDPGRDSAADDAPDTFTLVKPVQADAHVTPVGPLPRVSYSYSSVAAALNEEGEDRGFAAVTGPEEADEPLVAGDDATPIDAVPRAAAGDPTALGSAFHAAAQWMVETGASEVPRARLEALTYYWGCTLDQGERLEKALERWCASKVRAEALAWPCIRAEVPFFSLGMEDLAARFAPYAEGAIDLLCTDPADPTRALLVDYKTGGSPDETPEQLQEKHRLQAQVYADVLHRAGYADVTLKFVRVEQPDRAAGSDEPQVVTYRL